LNATNQIQSLSKKSQAQKFSYLGITFFPNITLMKLSDILQEEAKLDVEGLIKEAFESIEKITL